MKSGEKHKSQNKVFVVVLVGIVLCVAGFAGWLIWYINADPTIKLCDYKNLKVDIDVNDIATGSVSALGGISIGNSSEERLNQAVLDALVDNSKFYHLNKSVDARFDQFIAYYNQMVSLYDEYSSLEELAVNYYGYETYKDFEDAVREYSETAIKQEMALGAVAEREGFTVTDEIFNTYIKKYLAAYNFGEDEVEAFLETYGRADVYGVILNDYTLDRITEWNGLRG